MKLPFFSAMIFAMGGMALAQNNVDSAFCWSGSSDTKWRVITGSPDSTSGWWYDFNDKNDLGYSRILFPPDIEDSEGSFFGPLVETYGGIKGEVQLDEGYQYPYAGLGFHVLNNKPQGTDITAWGGICVAYESEITFLVELVVEDEKNVTGYDNYRAPATRSVTATYANLPWDKFQQVGWGKEADRDSVLKQVATVRLRFEGNAGTSGNFMITAIGSLNTCTPIYSCQLPKTNALKQTVPASSFKATLSGRILEFDGVTSLANASVVDLQGKVMTTAPATGIMNLSALKAGMYMLRIEGQGINHSQKLLLK